MPLFIVYLETTRTAIVEAEDYKAAERWVEDNAEEVIREVEYDDMGVWGVPKPLKSIQDIHCADWDEGALAFGERGDRTCKEILDAEAPPPAEVPVTDVPGQTRMFEEE